jgi:hypothetical protein
MTTFSCKTGNHGVLIDVQKLLRSVMPELLSRTEQHPAPRLKETALTSSCTNKDAPTNATDKIVVYNN